MAEGSVLKAKKRPADREGTLVLTVVIVLAVFVSACVTRPDRRTEPALRLSEIVDEGDAARRASNQLVLRGLDFDVEGRPARAEGQYLRAVQVDPNNPYAFLAMARHEAEGTDPRAALPLLDKTAALLWSQGDDPRVDAHLAGLRGQALYASGDYEGASPHLEEASALAPEVWSDGRLDAYELR